MPSDADINLTRDAVIRHVEAETGEHNHPLIPEVVALVHDLLIGRVIRGEVWCDYHGAVHAQDTNPYDEFVAEDEAETCSPDVWSEVVRGRTVPSPAVVVAPG